VPKRRANNKPEKQVKKNVTQKEGSTWEENEKGGFGMTEIDGKASLLHKLQENGCNEEKRRCI
jgi:hypothetical protein